jgi:hypothetical protein
VAGLGRDPRERDTGAVSLSGVSSAKRVAGDPFGVGNPGRLRVSGEQPTEGVGCEPPPTGCAAAERDEHRPQRGTAESEPVLERGDRVSVGMVAACHGDLGAGRVAVGLGSADPQDNAVGPRFEDTYALIDSYLYGFALQEASLPFEGPETVGEVAEPIMALMATGDYPAMVEMATTDYLQPGYDFADEFEFGLDLILDGLERRRH